MTVAFVFPGQGSQEVGMLAAFAAEPAVVRTLEEAADALSFDLARVIAEGPEADLARTEITQPALLTASVALWRLWRERGGAAPSRMAGHSLGEYSALVSAGALAFADGVRLVRERGRLMQRAVPAGAGAMAAILGLDDDAVLACCAGIDGVVSAANFNAPGQVVIAGATDAVDRAVAACQASGARRAMRLAVSVPSHCALMKPIEADFAAALARVPWALPTVPVVHNVDAAEAASGDAIAAKLLRQLSQPVQWTRCVERMRESGVDRYVECGPGRVLGGLIKRIDKAAGIAALGSAKDFAAALEVA